MARKLSDHADAAAPVRAGYSAIALAVIGSVLVGGAIAASSTPPPRTVRAALGLDGPDPPGLDRRRSFAVARWTASCMRALGLPYRPVPQPAPPIPDAGLGPVAWAERWGFGVTTSIGVRPATEVTDPNAAYAAALAPDEAAAYRAALFGADGASGCHGAANEEVHGLRARLLAPLDADLEDLGRAVDADAAMVAVRGSWSACIRPTADALALARSDRDRDRLPDALIAAFAARMRALRPTPPGPTTLGALQAFERRTAVRIARCEAAFAAGRAVVATAHESRFVREHAAALAEVGRSIREAEAALPDEPP